MDIRVYDNRVCCILDDKDLEPYGLSVEYMASRQPFNDKIILDLMNKASEITKKEYDIMGSDLNIETYADLVLYLLRKNQILYT